MGYGKCRTLLPDEPFYPRCAGPTGGKSRTDVSGVLAFSNRKLKHRSMPQKTMSLELFTILATTVDDFT